MIVGYICISDAQADYEQKLAAIEQAGPEHLFVEYRSAGPGPTLQAVLDDLDAGSTLVVWSLDHLASSLTELVTIVTTLERKGVFCRSLSDCFDTQRTTSTVELLEQLRNFQERTSWRFKDSGKNCARVGRPRALSSDDVQLAWKLLQQGRSKDMVAAKLKVSRTTLNRYLAEPGCDADDDVGSAALAAVDGKTFRAGTH